MSPTNTTADTTKDATQSTHTCHLPCQFGRLAMLYYPGRSYKAAIRAFRKEIQLTRGLLEALTAIGYQENQRLLSTRQVCMIEEFIGDP